MAPTTGSRKPTKKAAAQRRPKAASNRGKAAAARRKEIAKRGRAGIKRTSELSDDVLRSLEDGQRAALDAVHGFVDRVDKTLPALPHEDGPSRRQEIIDSGLEMADRLVHAQYDFIRRVIDSTGKSLSASGGGKRPAGAKRSAGAKKRSAGAKKRSTGAKRTAARKK
jgi:hypothetical protein